MHVLNYFHAWGFKMWFATAIAAAILQKFEVSAMTSQLQFQLNRPHFAEI